MFFTKKEPDNKLIDNFINELKLLNAQIAKLEAKIESLETKQNSLRGLINRKGVDYAEPQTETNIKSDGFDFLRRPF